MNDILFIILPTVPYYVFNKWNSLFFTTSIYCTQCLVVYVWHYLFYLLTLTRIYGTQCSIFTGCSSIYITTLIVLAVGSFRVYFTWCHLYDSFCETKERAAREKFKESTFHDPIFRSLSNIGEVVNFLQWKR